MDSMGSKGDKGRCFLPYGARGGVAEEEVPCYKLWSTGYIRVHASVQVPAGESSTLAIVLVPRTPCGYNGARCHRGS